MAKRVFSIILNFSCDIVDFLFSIHNFNNVEAEVRAIQRFLWTIKTAARSRIS